MVGPHVAVEFPEWGSLAVENIFIAVVADHFLPGYSMILRLVLIDFYISIATATIRSRNPDYVSTTQRDRNFVGYSQYHSTYGNSTLSRMDLVPE